jgi:hypothetical protein
MNPRPGIDRRTALKWMLTAAVSAGFTTRPGFAQQAAAPGGTGYGSDPELLRIYQPGELWPLTLSVEQRTCAAALCDLIIPADGMSPAASAVGVVDFIDEWVSAPYPDQQQHRPVVLWGLAWIDNESGRRFGQPFAAAAFMEQVEICDAICAPRKAAPELGKAAEFFALYRNLTAGGFYTTPEGRKDLGYVGNMPLAAFDGPPSEVLRQAGLA